jgi:hypothetical protein
MVKEGGQTPFRKKASDLGSAAAPVLHQDDRQIFDTRRTRGCTRSAVDGAIAAPQRFMTLAVVNDTINEPTGG